MARRTSARYTPRVNDDAYNLPPDRIPTPRSAPFEEERERTMGHLQTAFADDHLTLGEFDERMELARTAANDRELAVLLADVPGHEQTALVLQRDQPLAPTASSAMVPTGSTALVPAGSTQRMVAILGGVEREGRWVPSPKNQAIAFCGGVELDFRDVDLAPGSVTEVQCFAMFGGVEIEVPEGVRVEVGGTGIMGGFAQKGRGGDVRPDAPTVRVTGLALFGGVEVEVKRAKKKRRRWFGRD